jgi:hypothetical protein
VRADDDEYVEPLLGRIDELVRQSPALFPREGGGKVCRWRPFERR